MKHKTISDCECWDRSILGYHFNFVKLPSGYISAQAPMGDTEEEKELFDKLVYYNQRLYNGKDEEEIVQNIKDFIYENQNIKAKR